MAGSVHPRCVCQDTQCPRHGLCAACHTFHAAAGMPPKCERPQEAHAAAPANEAARYAVRGQGGAGREEL